MKTGRRRPFTGAKLDENGECPLRSWLRVAASGFPFCVRVTDRDAQSFGGVYLVEPRTRRRTSSAGIAFFDYLGVALSAFDDSLRKLGRTERSNQLVTQTPLPVILVGSVVYPFVLLSLRTAVYLGWGIAVFGFPAGQGNWPAAAMVLAASVLAFVGLGVLSASCSLVFKRG